jgi:transposase-like protein
MGLVMPYRCLAPIVRPACEGRRRGFNEADKQQILQEAVRPYADFCKLARRYGIAERVLFWWKAVDNVRGGDVGCQGWRTSQA